MISICIPSYNFDIRSLVQCLVKQISDNKLITEIIVIDDSSKESYKSINREVKNHCSHFVELDQNIGRSKIRNLFLNYASYKNLLFLDCDGEPINDKFLANYIDNLQHKVVVGGRIYGERPIDLQQLLHWTYGTLRESKSYQSRQLSMYKSFMTNNFMIDTDVLKEIKFDESISQYGHEDTLMGLLLEQNEISIEHIDNPVLNKDIEINASFLNKVKTSVRSLYSIYSNNEYAELLLQNVKLLRYWKATRWLSSIYLSVYAIFSNTIDKNLLGNSPSMFFLDLFKLKTLLLIEKEANPHQ